MFDRFLDFFFGKLLWFFTEGAQLSLLDSNGCYNTRVTNVMFERKCLGESLPEIAAFDHSPLFPWWSILLSIIQWLVMVFLWAMILGFLVYAVISLVMWFTSKDWRGSVKNGGKMGPFRAIGSAFLMSIAHTVPISLFFFSPLPIANPLRYSSATMKMERYNPVFVDWLSWKVAAFSPKLYVYLDMFNLKLSLGWWIFTAGQPLPAIARSTLGM